MGKSKVFVDLLLNRVAPSLCLPVLCFDPTLRESMRSNHPFFIRETNK